MNDMSGIPRLRRGPQERPLGESIRPRAPRRCPACGRGRLFRAYLKTGAGLQGLRGEPEPRPRRRARLSHHAVVCHLAGAGVLMSDDAWPGAPLMATIVVWLAFAAAVSLLILPRNEGGGGRPARRLSCTGSEGRDVIAKTAPGPALRPRDAGYADHRDRTGADRRCSGPAVTRATPSCRASSSSRRAGSSPRTGQAAAGALDPYVEETDARVPAPISGFGPRHRPRRDPGDVRRDRHRRRRRRLWRARARAPRRLDRFAEAASIPTLADRLFSPAPSPRRTNEALRRALSGSRRQSGSRRRIDGVVHSQAEADRTRLGRLAQARELDLPNITRLRAATI